MILIPSPPSLSNMADAIVRNSYSHATLMLPSGSWQASWTSHQPSVVVACRERRVGSEERERGLRGKQLSRGAPTLLPCPAVRLGN